MNVAVEAREGRALLKLPGGIDLQSEIAASDLPSGETFRLGLRAEAIRLDPQGTMPGKVEVVERLGDRTHVHTRIADDTIIVAEDVGMSQAAPGDRIALRLDAAQAHLFDAQGRGYRAHAARRA
jgi:multiple sugar transport system ATP-binding protein